MNSVAIIGSGFAGLSAACYLAKAGRNVTIYEKNASIGGRARVYRDSGFTFDMGPSWYWMPDVFERFFENFEKKPSDYYNLVQLDPGFQIVFGNSDILPIPKSIDELYAVFEKTEPGSARKLEVFLKEAAFKYEVGMGRMVNKPSFSWLEYLDADVIKSMAKLQMFSPVSKAVRSSFKDKRLIALLEFPVLFLGAMADKIPALYTLMNYAALSLGTWYPMGGMYQIVHAMEQLAVELGVKIITNSEVKSINVNNGNAVSLNTVNGIVHTDAVVATGDYHHIEQELLPEKCRRYTPEYWDNRVFAPSCLIFYLGVNKKLEKLIHHNLFFDADIDQHSNDIYTQPKWPLDPLFYVCCPSKTDNTVAPEGMENLFILIPVAPNLEDTQAIREQYFDIVIKRLELHCKDEINSAIIYKKDYCIADFKNDYHAYKGNAYGLANTLLQTAVLKPSMRNKNVKNLFYAGQLTVPGPGVPPSLISGMLAANEIDKYLNVM